MPHRDVRGSAILALKKYLPSRAGEEWFDQELCQGLMSDNGFDPGPELCNWLLWKLGCNDSRILFRSVPENNIVRSGRGTQKLVEGAGRLGAWCPYRLDGEPKPGDLLHLGNARRGVPEHTCVFVEAVDGMWKTADIVPCERLGHFKADFIIRKLHAGSMVGRTGSEKQINGWVDLEAVFQL